MKAPRVCILASLLLFLCGGSLFAQHKEMKYGKVGKKEFSLYHPTDSTTDAVFLNKEGYTYYRQENDGRIRVESEFKFRLQVLRPEGTRYADVDILYYRGERLGTTQEQISAIGASAYNLVDGKLVEAPLDRKYIF